jgi:NadR type nicotinamide-nucleotide adenylyltransferase
LNSSEPVQALIRKVAVLGPECSGKTTLSIALAAHFGAPWVAEMARGYLERIGRAYKEPDLLLIAKAQLAEERAKSESHSNGPPRFLFCDTEMITIRIWSHEKYGRVVTALEQLVQQNNYDHYLLCRPDIPWEADPLRENPTDRGRLFHLYEAALIELGRPYTIIEGTPAQRLHRSVAAVLSGEH